LEFAYEREIVLLMPVQGVEVREGYMESEWIDVPEEIVMQEVPVNLQNDDA
jgi:hypothetical protein